MRTPLRASLAAALAASLSSFATHAGYLDVSPNWKTPATVEMSKSTAKNVVSRCNDVSTYSGLAGRTSGAMIVAGPHPTPTDAKIHLTVRLYKNNHHDKSCHVYTGKNNSFASCSCNYVD